MWYLYIATMFKTSSGPKSIVLKVVVTALVLTLGGSLFAAGAISADACGMRCCCLTDPTHNQPAAKKQVRSVMGCCSEAPARPCDLQTAKPFEFPEMIPTPGNEDLHGADGLTVILSDADENFQNYGGSFFSQALNSKFSSSPLYLQNLTFLI